MPASDWIEFWDAKHPIYVNTRHETAHFRRLAEDIRSYAPAGGTMLDYGCGAALSADVVAGPVARLFLCEPAPNTRLQLAARFGGNAKIAVRRPEDIAAMPDHSIDVIVMHSVAQYLDATELESLLRLFRRLLKPRGLLVVGDIIPRKLPALADALALLRFGWRDGFFVAAVAGLVRTFFSDYWRLRQSLGLTRYDRDEIIAKLEAANFKAEPAHSNIGHNAKRMTFLAHAH
jgi:SAM-dependent methyltransferase